ncbi:hypothetical protein [Microvirga pakistanensis]|uniref:hypothetical protein n=1 Tax=Microvirga pakistanensis TaxID=1682650 RepID=UPI00106D220E|nr:hypothetical protein [Microvirga pakistanensis]
MNNAGVDAPLGQAFRAIFTIPGHGSPVALNVATVSARACTLLALQGVFATLHMTRRALLHLLGVVARIVHVLMAELAFHESLLAGVRSRPT